MLLKIANLYLEIGCPARVAEVLDNLRPFVQPEGDCPPEGPLLRMSPGRDWDFPSSRPDVEEDINGKHISIWLSDQGCDLALAPHGSRRTFRLRADRKWRKVLTDVSLTDREGFEALNDFIMLSFTYAAAFARTVLIHASCVAAGDECAAFIGHSGAGKSTHSALWLRHVPGTRLLNDDQPALQAAPDGTVRIFGTPWSGKTPCYRQDSARLKAFFLMEQAQENRLVRQAPLEAFRTLLCATSLIGRDGRTFGPISRTVAAVAGRIPVYTLRNRPEEAAVRLSLQHAFPEGLPG